MKNQTVKIILCGVIAASIFAIPALLHAGDTNGTSSASAPAMPKKHGAPFHGTLDDLDTNAMTITVGSRTFQITSTTKITKNGQPAILSDGVLGQPISGYYRPSDDGTTLNAATVHFGGSTKTAKKKKTQSDVATTATNAPASSGN